MAVMRDFRHAVRLNPKTLLDLAQAIAELAIARILLAHRTAEDLRNVEQSPFEGNPSPAAERLIKRVSFVVPRMGARVPWRADCLVQALAAQRWLRRRGVVSSIVVGVRKPAPADFEAHAWLMAGDRVVTGGPVDSYTVILNPPTR